MTHSVPSRPSARLSAPASAPVSALAAPRIAAVCRRHRLLLAVLAVGLLLTACVFDDLLEVTVLGNTVFISLLSTSTICEERPPGSGEFECTYFPGDKGSILSRFTISTELLLLQLSILDPLVVQLPATASALTGSYLHFPSGDSGPLAITGGLASVPADSARSLAAEPGTQLVVLDLPPGAPTTGDFAFNFNFAMPPGSTSVPWKALFTGRIEVEGEGTFYPPLLPCVTDMALVPEIVIPLPAGGPVSLPIGQISGCDGEIYQYGDPVPVELQRFVVDDDRGRPGSP